MSFASTEFIESPAGKIAYRRTLGNADKVGLVWCGGLRSDMMGGKATELHQAAIEADHSFLRFDYTGHGESDVPFAQTTIADWKRDAIFAIDELTNGPLILVGSSMGGWTSLLSAMARPDRIKGMVLIAPAPDFTEKLMWKEFTSEQRRQVEEEGFWMRPSPYEGDYPITKDLLDAGRALQIMDAPIDLGEIPVRIIQGMRDDAVPWTHAQELMNVITSEDVHFHMVKDGDHRMSRPQDIALIKETVFDIARKLGG
ncbi:alpha/beta hydrolase [Hirschia litorea]|uniref:Palmitoyl-protein thioesterase ABHD10, mitochondrial n=1 Tax=Hirschia litorea TaxID=1199156 RepID=A0ABW2IM69_9PROT